MCLTEQHAKLRSPRNAHVDANEQTLGRIGEDEKEGERRGEGGRRRKRRRRKAA